MAQTVTICRACGRENPSNYGFCGNCGTARVDDESSDTVPSPAAPSSAGKANGPGSIDRSEATRYLCAAMHLDTKLADEVIEQLIEDDHHAFGPSDGIDLHRIACQALSARRHQRTRDAFLILFGVVAVIGVVGRMGVLFLAGLVLLWLTVCAEALSTRYGVLAGMSRGEGFRSVDPPVPSSPRLRKRLEEIDSIRNGNVVVYSGYSPFVGSGHVLNGWSFVIDITKRADPNRPVDPVGTDELRTAVVKAVDGLGWSEIAIEDQIFVSGTDVRGDHRFLPDPFARPVRRVEDHVVHELIDHPETTARHYLRFRFNAWGGEIIVSLFLRFVLREQSMFVEASYSLLPPLKAEYHQVDDVVTPPTLRQVFSVLGRSALRTPDLTLRSLPRVAGSALAPITRPRRQRQERRRIREHLAFDYGARPTVREQASDKLYHRYFQRLDKDMYVKVVEKRILTCVIDYLALKGIDTADLEERQTTILNNGVMISGGSLTAENVAVGEGSRATKIFSRKEE